MFVILVEEKRQSVSAKRNCCIRICPAFQTVKYNYRVYFCADGSTLSVYIRSETGLISRTSGCDLISGKPLLMLQSVKRGFAIDPNHPQLHECLVLFLQYGTLDQSRSF